ncbi:MAG: AraC family transcriptional regulator [Bacteroidota bacterium]
MKPVYEQVPVDPNSEITGFIYEEDDFYAPWHYHPECELTCILEGQGMRYVGNHLSAFEGFDLVLLRGNLPHCWKNISNSGRAKSVVIQWEEQIIPNIKDLQAITGLVKLAGRGIRFSTSVSKKILPKLLKLTEEGENTYIGLLEILSVLSTEKEVDLLAGEAFLKRASFESHDKLGKVLDFIAENYHRKIKLSDLAIISHMTESSFSRFFSKNFQKPFTAYLNEYRINRSCRLLIETDTPISQIAYDCGYESHSFFHTQFQKYVGNSPLSYRKLYRKGINVS